MYKNGESAIERILSLVGKCPKELQEKCFEVLLKGYVQIEVGPPAGAHGQEFQSSVNQENNTQKPPSETNIPPAILHRFKNAAKRIGIDLERLDALFDFSVDPFSLHAISVPGNNSGERTRNVALLAAARSYLASGSWAADRQEVKALCVDQNCYDQTNFSTILKRGEGTIFKNVETGKPIELSNEGVKEAEKLLKSLAEGSAA